jgi:hypothetical protein
MQNEKCKVKSFFVVQIAQQAFSPSSRTATLTSSTSVPTTRPRNMFFCSDPENILDETLLLLNAISQERGKGFEGSRI